MHRSAMWILCALLVTLAAVRAASAQVSITVDKLDPTDGGAQPPPGIVVVDVLIDAATTDAWAAGGVRGTAYSGASLRYSAPGGTPVLVNPGVADRFVTFASGPRLRDDNLRFTSGGAVVSGALC